MTEAGNLPFGAPAAVIATVVPEDVRIHDIRLALAGNPHVALGILRCQGDTNPPYTGLSDELLGWLGRVGTAHGRKLGERHFLRIVPFLREGWQHTPWRKPHEPTRGITDIVVVHPEMLGADALLDLLDAAAAAASCLWLLCGTTMPVDTGRLIRAHAGLYADWQNLWEQWRQRNGSVPQLSCLALSQRWWRAPTTHAHGSDAITARRRTRAERAHAGVVGDWTSCPVHRDPLGCLRASFAYAIGTVEMTDSDGLAVCLDLIRATNMPRWQVHDLARDTFAPARDCVDHLCRQAGLDPALVPRTRLSALDQEGRTLAIGGHPLPVPELMRPAVLRQRTMSLLSGGTANSPLLTIFGEGAQLWSGRAPRPR